MELDYVLNGTASGSVADRLLESNFDVGSLRPYIGDDNRSVFVDRMVGNELKAVPVHNATATLRKDDWKLLDEAILPIAKARLKAVADLRSRGLQFTIPNGMGKTMFEYETQSDITPAEASMDGISRSVSDRPLFELKNLPLPIIHKEFFFTARQIQSSRNGGSPLDTTTAQLAARQVAEGAEKMLIGTFGQIAFGGGNVYGYTNFPNRLTKTMTAPDGTNQATTVREVLNMRKLAQDKNYFGPYALYVSTTWDEYLDDDYSSSKGTNTLRQRLAAIDGITGIQTLDYLPDKTMVLLHLGVEVARAVIGMDITTVQWDSHGGLQKNFKVMTIQVPQIRADQSLQTGIVHGTYA